MIISKIGSVVCTSLLLAVASPGPAIVGTLSGIDGKPLAGVIVSVESLPGNREVERTVSKSDGSFSFASLASGSYGVVAKAGTNCAFSNALQVGNGFTTTLRLRLVKDACDGAISF